MSVEIESVSERKELQHFSHDHPLIYAEVLENPKARCSACGFLLLSSPSYRCSKDCNFFLHHPCSELPKYFSSYHLVGRYYEMELFAKPPSNSCNCKGCGKLCKNFTYVCLNIFSRKTIYLHCQCAFPPEINMKHISHLRHPLMPVWKDASLECDACGSDRKGTFLSCSKCSFYIHQDCCLLPSIAKINQHRHVLSLNYSYIYSVLWLNNKCLICNDKVSRRLGEYTCNICTRRAHLNCVASTLEEPEIGTQVSMGLPNMLDTFQGFITGKSTKNNNVETESEDVKSKIEKYHMDHSSWVFHNGESDIQLVCNACIQPITSPPISHYGCPQPQCNFLLHQFCANLHSVIKDYLRDGQLYMYSESSKFCRMFNCCRCLKKCNGFGYRYGRFSIDVVCAMAPVIIEHESHNRHPLALTRRLSGRISCCELFEAFKDGYSCGICNYHIHVRCASLPKTVEHKFDEHPLDLIHNVATQIPRTEVEHHHLCEICEEYVVPKFWFCHCGKCDQSFHTDCIPSTGWLSTIKFGRNIDLPRAVHHHPCTLTRMLTMGSQRCGFCEDMIHGFVDAMAFHCSVCDFWIHFGCAEDSVFVNTWSDENESEGDSSDENESEGDSSDGV